MPLFGRPPTPTATDSNASTASSAPSERPSVRFTPSVGGDSTAPTDSTPATSTASDQKSTFRFRDLFKRNKSTDQPTESTGTVPPPPESNGNWYGQSREEMDRWYRDHNSTYQHPPDPLRWGAYGPYSQGDPYQQPESSYWTPPASQQLRPPYSYEQPSSAPTASYYSSGPPPPSTHPSSAPPPSTYPSSAPPPSTYPPPHPQYYNSSAPTTSPNTTTNHNTSAPTSQQPGWGVPSIVEQTMPQSEVDSRKSTTLKVIQETDASGTKRTIYQLAPIAGRSLTDGGTHQIHLTGGETVMYTYRPATTATGTGTLDVRFAPSGYSPPDTTTQTQPTQTYPTQTYPTQTVPTQTSTQNPTSLPTQGYSQQSYYPPHVNSREPYYPPPTTPSNLYSREPRPYPQPNTSTAGPNTSQAPTTQYSEPQRESEPNTFDWVTGAPHLHPREHFDRSNYRLQELVSTATSMQSLIPGLDGRQARAEAKSLLNERDRIAFEDNDHSLVQPSTFDKLHDYVHRLSEYYAKASYNVRKDVDVVHSVIDVPDTLLSHSNAGVMQWAMQDEGHANERLERYLDEVTNSETSGMDLRSRSSLATSKVDTDMARDYWYQRR